jgi:hypothetical protein
VFNQKLIKLKLYAHSQIFIYIAILRTTTMHTFVATQHNNLSTTTTKKRENFAENSKYHRLCWSYRKIYRFLKTLIENFTLRAENKNRFFSLTELLCNTPYIYYTITKKKKNSLLLYTQSHVFTKFSMIIPTQIFFFHQFTL